MTYDNLVLLIGDDLKLRSLLRTEVEAAGSWRVIEVSIFDAARELSRSGRPLATFILATQDSADMDIELAHALAASGVPTLFLKNQEATDLRSVVRAVLTFGVLFAPAVSA